jgi:hypothetical protein
MADLQLTHYTWAGTLQFNFDFSDDLLTGQTVASVAATHIPPSGNAVTPTVVHTPGDNTGAVLVPTLAVTGEHVIRVVATKATPTSSGHLRVVVFVAE